MLDYVQHNVWLSSDTRPHHKVLLEAWVKPWLVHPHGQLLRFALVTGFTLWVKSLEENNWKGPLGKDFSHLASGELPTIYDFQLYQDDYGLREALHKVGIELIHAYVYDTKPTTVAWVAESALLDRSSIAAKSRALSEERLKTFDAGDLVQVDAVGHPPVFGEVVEVVSPLGLVVSLLGNDSPAAYKLMQPTQVKVLKKAVTS